MVEFAVTGDGTGRTWAFHPVSDRLKANGERYRATAVDDQSLACVHRVEKEPLWDAELAGLRTAIAIARLPEVKATSEIRQLLDARETETVSGEFGYPGALEAIWEWGDISLRDFIRSPDEEMGATASGVEASVGKALEMLHSLGWIHLDVAPNNILRVDGTWKLADLDACTKEGERALKFPLKQLPASRPRRSARGAETHASPARVRHLWSRSDAGTAQEASGRLNSLAGRMGSHAPLAGPLPGVGRAAA